MCEPCRISNALRENAAKKLEEIKMKTYTLESVYAAQYAYLMDDFIGLYDRQPNIGEENSIIAEARSYAKEFMENLADWQADRDRDDRNR